MSPHIGAASSGKTGAGGVAAGLAGIARAGGDSLRARAAGPANALRDAYTSGSQSAWRATGGGSSGDATSTPAPASQSPDWARRMQSRQTMTQASQMAAHTLRDGDRGSPGAAPTLKDKDE